MSARNSSYNKRRSVQTNSSDRWISLLLYYITPFVIFNSIIFFCVTAKPKCTIKVADTNDYLTTEVTMSIDSWFPIKSVSLTMDTEEIELEKKSGRTYKALISKNGTLEVNVVNLNGMPLTQFEHIVILDDNPPEIESYNVEDGLITLTFSDSQSGVNVESIHALNSNDQQLSPLSLDRATATATFEMDPAGIRIYAQDMAGHTIERTFTSRKEGDAEILQSDETISEDGEIEEAEGDSTETIE